MNNRWNFNNPFLSDHGIYMPSMNDESYIPSVTWDDFVHQPMRYIECAVRHKDNIVNYQISTDVKGDSRRSFFYG